MKPTHRLPRRLHLAAMALCALGFADAAKAQNVAINATGAAAAPIAILDVSSITKGLFIPRMSSLPPAPATLPSGLTVFLTGAANVRGLYAVQYGQWMPIVNGNNGWDIYGNYLTNVANPNKDFIGTTDNKAMYFRTNGIHRMRLDATTGYLGIGWPVGAAASKERLDINGAIRQYYVPGGGVETSNTDLPGVFRYQTRGTWTGTGQYKYGSNEKLAVNPNNATANLAVLGTVNNYPLQYAGHWGNVDGTAMRQGTNTPTVVQPKTNGWRAFENPYDEYINQTWSHFKEAQCDGVVRYAYIPSDLGAPATYTMSDAVAPTTTGESDFVTPFLSYAAGRMYMRRQYLYLAAELNVELAQVNGHPNAINGLCPGEPVTEVGFWVQRNQGRTLLTPTGTTQNITVRNAPLGLTALNGFDNTSDNNPASAGCGTPSPTWPATAGLVWQTVSLSPPFIWDGVSNVIIEVAMRYQSGTANPLNNPVGCTDTGFNASYGANTLNLSATVPYPVPDASCGNSTNPSSVMADNSVTSGYYSGASHWRPVVRFRGKTAAVSAAPTSGTNANYIYYPGALVVEDTSTVATNIPWGRWRANYPAGNTYWAYQGIGTISAQYGVYDNGSRLNDHVFDRAFDGRVAPSDAANFGEDRLLSIDEMEAFTREHRHLPTMKGRAAWKEKDGFSLGDLTNQLWATTETHALYVADLHDKLNVIEMLTNERPLTPAEFKVAQQDLGTMTDLTDAEKARLIADLRKRVTLTSSSR